MDSSPVICSGGCTADSWGVHHTSDCTCNEERVEQEHLSERIDMLERMSNPNNWHHSLQLPSMDNKPTFPFERISLDVVDFGYSDMGVVLSSEELSKIFQGLLDKSREAGTYLICPACGGNGYFVEGYISPEQVGCDVCGGNGILVGEDILRFLRIMKGSTGVFE